MTPRDRALATRATQQAAVARLGQIALTRHHEQRVMDEAVRAIAATLEVEYAKVLELLPSGAELLLRAGVGWREGAVDRARVSSGANSQAGYTLASDAPVVVEDLLHETRFRGQPLLLEHSVVSGITCVIRGAGGQPFGLLGAHTGHRRTFSDDDINFVQSVANILGAVIQRERAERALGESEQLYRHVVNAALDALLIYPLNDGDVPGRFVEVNEAAVRRLGYTREELLAMGPLDITETDLDTFRRDIARVRSGEQALIETHHLTREGERIPVELSARVTRLASRDHVIAVARDITERKRAERELETRNRRLRLLFDTAAGLLSSEDPVRAFDEIFHRLEAELGVDVYLHHAFGADGRHLELAGWAGLPENGIARTVRLRPGRAVYPHLITRGDEIVIENVPESRHPVALFVRDLGVRSLVSHPLRGREGTIGSLVFASRQRARLDKGTLDFLRAVCDQFATALDRGVARRSEGEIAARLRAIVDTAVDGILTIAERGIIESVNPAAERIFGYSAEDMIGRDVQRLMPELDPREYDGSRHRDGAGTGTGIGIGRELEGRRRDGSGVPLELAIGETRLNGRRLYTVVLRDITERKRAEEKLRESERRFRLMADAAPVLIAVSDAEGRPTYLNRAWVEFTGRSLEHGIVEGCLDSIHPDHRELGIRALRQAVQTREPLQLEVRLRRHDGEYRWILCHALPRFGPGGEYLGHIASGVDITGRKEMEEQLRTLNVRLKRLNDTLEERIARRTARLERQSARLRLLAAELTRAEQRERQRLAGLIHDHLQQLLVASRMRLESASRRGSGEEVGSMLEDAATLIGESLEVTRTLTAELRPPLLHEQGLAPALDWLAERMKEQYGLRVITKLEGTAEPGDETVRSLLFEATRELLFNVVKHAGVQVARLSTAVLADGSVRLVVQDRGAGFDPRQLETDEGMIDRFGLLSIRERLQALNGRFRVRSSPGVGTRIELRAPLGHGPPADRESPGAADHEGPSRLGEMSKS